MINKELVDYIKSELSKGSSLEDIRSACVSRGGWTSSDLNEAFNTLSIHSSTTEKKSKLIFVIPLIILFISSSAFAGWKFYEPEIKSFFRLSFNNSEAPNLESDVNSKILNNVLEVEKSDSIVILSPINGDKVISGSNLSVRYKITNSNVDGLIIVGGCLEEIQNKSEGEYTFECKINDEKLGYITIGAIDVNSQIKEVGVAKDPIKLEVVAPSNLKPVEITWFGETQEKFTGNYDFIGLVGNDSNYIAVSIKYNDGSIKTIPFSYLKYTINNPEVLSLAPFNKETNIVHLLPLKPGKATIILEYEGLKKEAHVYVDGINYAYQNDTYNFYFDLSGIKILPSFQPNTSAGFGFVDENGDFIFTLKVFVGEKKATEKLAKKFLEGYVYKGKTIINNIEYDNYIWGDGETSSKHYLVYRDGVQYYLNIFDPKYLPYFGFIY